MYYINYKYDRNDVTETVFASNDLKETRRMLGEYTYGGNCQGMYWISKRASKLYYEQNRNV